MNAIAHGALSCVNNCIFVTALHFNKYSQFSIQILACSNSREDYSFKSNTNLFQLKYKLYSRGKSFGNEVFESLAFRTTNVSLLVVGR